MGTNFYFFTKEKELRHLYSSKWELVDEPEFGYKLHIAKTSMGWLPLFEEHEKIKSVKNIKDLYNTGYVKIFDEYGIEYDWNAFKERVLEHNGGTTAKRHIEYISEERISEQKAYELYDPNFPNFVPISHFEYKGINPDNFFKDEEGYEFDKHAFT